LLLLFPDRPCIISDPLCRNPALTFRAGNLATRITTDVFLSFRRILAMPSPFPGMDPFLEGDEWEDFHSRFITTMAVKLLPGIRPDYAVRTERRIYVEHPLEDVRTIRPDVAILRNPDNFGYSRSGSAAAVATLEPVERTVPMSFEVEEKYLVIRRLDSSAVVTVIELLSPFNKRMGTRGRPTYLAKRQEVIQSATNLVELDLLRGGERLPTLEPLPVGDYFALIRRSTRRSTFAVYAWPMNHRLPTIPIPLDPGDREVTLDLQAVFDTVYDEAGYDYSLSYRREMSPPFSDEESTWVKSLLPNGSSDVVVD
ncbi:MAG TPA: DUF4058 family protein, partial [Planctomycetaceae bacterium]|nr:DUF4058 family protein [Planctomycetaceae bacterium]